MSGTICYTRPHRSHGRIVHDQFLAGGNLDLIATEQLLVGLDAAVASSNAALIQDQIAVLRPWAGDGAAPVSELLNWREETESVARPD